MKVPILPCCSNKSTFDALLVLIWYFVLTEETQSPTKNGPFVPPLPVDTPPNRPPIPDGTPPITPDGQRRPRFPALPGQPPLPMVTPPGMPPIPDDTPPVTPVINRRLSDVGSQDLRGGSPSLEDLENQYKLIQDRLADSDGTGSDGVDLQVVDSCDGDDVNDSITDADSQTSDSIDIACRQLPRVGSATSINTFGELGSGSPAHSLPGTPIINPSGPSFNNINFTFKSKTGSISQDFGTPIMNRSFVPEALPDSSNFGKDIEDHIPYENLPNATGAFQKMNGLIKRIRQKVSFKKKKL